MGRAVPEEKDWGESRTSEDRLEPLPAHCEGSSHSACSVSPGWAAPEVVQHQALQRELKLEPENLRGS